MAVFGTQRTHAALVHTPLIAQPASWRFAQSCFHEPRRILRIAAKTSWFRVTMEVLTAIRTCMSSIYRAQ